jgi:ABC-type Mn2+/Zn2+ transport system ATPase subunit
MSANSATSEANVVECDRVGIERHGVTVLEDITFNVPRGTLAGLVGPNGAGKTTLLKAMLGLVPISSGRLELFGRSADSADRKDRSVGYVPQRVDISVRFPASVADVVLMGRYAEIGTWGFPRASDRADALQSLELVGIRDLARRSVGRLSGGEQRRVLLAQALTASTRLLILDEPTIGLDLPAEHEFYALLRRLQKDLSLTIVVVSHDLVALAGEADQLMCINRKMHVHGNPDDVVHSHAIREAYSCEFDFIAGELAHHEHEGAKANDHAAPKDETD